MDAKEQRKRIAELVTAWAEGKSFRHLDADGQWRETQPRGEWLFHEPERWRVAEEPEKCAMCGEMPAYHGDNACKCEQFIPLSLAGPRPEPPDGWELMEPGRDVRLHDLWWDTSDGKWNEIDCCPAALSRDRWRARRTAEKPATVSDHEMLLEMSLSWAATGNELAKRFLAQEGGK